jgi:hypothetical protein
MLRSALIAPVRPYVRRRLASVSRNSAANVLPFDGAQIAQQPDALLERRQIRIRRFRQRDGPLLQPCVLRAVLSDECVGRRIGGGRVGVH